MIDRNEERKGGKKSTQSECAIPTGHLTPSPSARVTLRLTCSMEFADYPFDEQVCGSIISSCEYGCPAPTRPYPPLSAFTRSDPS
ncbi:hypothetical protein E2C01_014300 [Portunus trituberculatus]|uniref:Neurotransmitter-gated ion-channel ligand-binding domain-containing protein n=1 Tax=Portunus trituberculatus TaxID=210409 RepID=A0A5B7DJF8_PORTR|nr:hypothetical protein [Portunus trituberculatus]